MKVKCPAYAEARFAPGSKEFIGLVPAIKAHAEAIPPEHAINFPESRFNPSVVVVVGDGAPNAGRILTRYGGSVSTKSALP